MYSQRNSHGITKVIQIQTHPLISQQSITYLLRYLSLDQSGGPVDEVSYLKTGVKCKSVLSELINTLMRIEV